MPINYDEIMSLKSENIEISYTDKDSILYGLGVGLGNDPMNMDELNMFMRMDKLHFLQWLQIFNTTLHCL